MSSYSPVPEQWYSEYEVASSKQRYQMLNEVLEQPLSPEFIQHTDLAGLLLEMQEELSHNGLFRETVILIDKFRESQPELYAQEYPYFDQFLIQYYLYTSEPKKVKASLIRFKEKPAQGIDSMLQLVDFLKFYNAREIATDLCRATYTPVETSPDIIGGTEAELAGVILMDMMESAYQTLQQGQAVDWAQFLAEAQQYGYEADEAWIQDIHQDLSKDVEINDQFFKEFKKQSARGDLLRTLSVNFHKYMAEQKQISFICSQGIWENVMNFLINHRDLKKYAHPNGLFGFSQNQLDRFLAQQIGGFLTFSQAKGFATLWGLPYLYDFLLMKQIISSEIHQRTLASVSDLKQQLMAGLTQLLWKYDFVHCWSPPDSISQAQWDEEVKQFHTSLESVTPLSDEPNSGRTDLLTQEFREFFGEEDDEELDFGADQLEPTGTLPSVTFGKPPKPKKSPLQEAAQLSPGKSKKSKKGKKRGFSNS